MGPLFLSGQSHVKMVCVERHRAAAVAVCDWSSQNAENTELVPEGVMWQAVCYKIST